PQGKIPPSSIVRLGLYKRFTSISFNTPNPEQLGQAPSGELNENDAGVIWGYDISQLGQVLFSEKKYSLSSSLIFISPLDCNVPSSIESLNLFWSIFFESSLSIIK